jgi:hypothetical protein
MSLDYELFKGISIQLTDVESADERAAQLASLPSVKNIWPVTIVDGPEPILLSGGGLGPKAGGSPESAEVSRRRRDVHESRQTNSTVKSKGSIVQTQIDKLHAQGITGEGITIAVIDTGVGSLT